MSTEYYDNKGAFGQLVHPSHIQAESNPHFGASNLTPRIYGKVLLSTHHNNLKPEDKFVHVIDIHRLFHIGQ